MTATKIMKRITRFSILVVLPLPTFGSKFATLPVGCSVVNFAEQCKGMFGQISVPSCPGQSKDGQLN